MFIWHLWFMHICIHKCYLAILLKKSSLLLCPLELLLHEIYKVHETILCSTCTHIKCFFPWSLFYICYRCNFIFRDEIRTNELHLVLSYRTSRARKDLGKQVLKHAHFTHEDLKPGRFAFSIKATFVEHLSDA